MESHNPLRIFLALPHVLERESIKQALDAREEYEVIRATSHGDGAVDEILLLQPDVAILDGDLWGGSAAIVGSIKEQVPNAKVIILQNTATLESLIAAVEAGADGYFTKDRSLEDLLRATHAVREGEMVVPPKMLGALVDHLVRRNKRQTEESRRLAGLTVREKEVLRMLAEGANNTGISRALVISPQTTRTHIQNLLKKLGVHSRLEAASFVIKNQLMEELAVAA